MDYIKIYSYKYPNQKEISIYTGNFKTDYKFIKNRADAKKEYCKNKIKTIL